VGNILLLVLNIPLVGLWVKLLAIPYRYLFPSALLFISVGFYSINNDLFEVAETMGIGVFGFLLMRLGFHPAPILLGFVLGPRFEENFRRALTLSRGDLSVFVQTPIAAVFVALCVLLLAGQVWFALRPRRDATATPATAGTVMLEEP
jgi:TctA family transporter